MKKIAILAAGFAPGQSEITETISLLISLSELKTYFQIFCVNTITPLNHHELYPVDALQPEKFDALVLPGGRGNTTLLSTWADDKEKMKVVPAVEKIISTFYAQSKPIGAICIAPLVVARVLSKHRPNVTLGESFEETALIQKAWNITVDTCPSTDFITDRDTKVITTPAYMNEATPFEVYSGIRSFCKELVEMA